MTRRLYRSIPGRIVGLYLTMTVLSLATITYLFDRTTHDSILSSVESHLETITANKSDLVSRWMGEREHDVEVVAKNATVVDDTSQLVGAAPNDAPAARSSLGQLLRLVRDQYGAYHDIFIFDRHPQLLASSRGDGAPPELDDAALLEAVSHGRHYVSSAYLHPGQRTLALNLASPIETPQGELLGAVVAVVDLGAIKQMTDAMELMTSGEAYLVDERGVFITHRDSRRVLRDDISAAFGITEVIHGRSGVGVYRDYRGIPVVGAYQWIPRWRWGLVAEVDRDEAFAPIEAARRHLLLIVGFVTLAVFLGTALVVRTIVRPLRELTRAVQAVASGELDQHVGIAANDEVGMLSVCFNQMAKNLGEARSAMDDRIRAATASLAQKNAELSGANEQLLQINRELEQQRAIVAQTARFAAMGEMAAGIAHEINNPLTTMRNLIHTLRSADPNDAGRQRDLEVVDHEIQRINSLVANFLKCARPPQTNIRPVRVQRLVDHTLKLLAPQAHGKRIKVVPEVERDLPPVPADEEQLVQVLVNLLLNAIQASPAAAEVRVAARAVYRHGEATPARVEIAVTDHGPGIAAEAREKVFSPFYTTKADGSGLGLAISQRIVEAHGGTLTFSSVPDGETTFVVSLVRPERSRVPRDAPEMSNELATRNRI
jgi:signal transduction histidine kinase